METSETSESSVQNLNNEIEPKVRSAEKEKLVEELSCMGFSKSLVQQVKYLNG